MEAVFNPRIRAAGSVASPHARSAGFDAAVSNPRRRFAQSQATRKGLAGSTSRPVEFLFRSAMSEPEKTGREFRSRTWARFFRGRGDQSIHRSVRARVSNSLLRAKLQRRVGHRGNGFHHVVGEEEFAVRGHHHDLHAVGKALRHRVLHEQRIRF
jgi:hypothetical protein